MTAAGGGQSPGASPPDAGWRILDTRFHGGLAFLEAWHAWKQDPQRPRILHFVAIADAPCAREALIEAAAAHPHLLPLADTLSHQWLGLTPGAQRLAFEQGRVLLTLHVRDALEMLRKEAFTVDEVLLHAGIDAQAVKLIARHCRRGTRVAVGAATSDLRHALAASGFRFDVDQDVGPTMEVVFDPGWEPRGMRRSRSIEPRDALVIGAGLAGAATAASLARRGWQVTVIDASCAPAAGASSLPVGLLAPHYSPDDNLLSRLSRAGVRMTMREARELLREGEDWSRTGVLERRVGETESAPTCPAHFPWSAPAPACRKLQALLGDQVPALWHEQAAWIKPAALVRAWLGHPLVAWRAAAPVAAIERHGERWAARDAEGAVIAGASLVVVAAALASSDLLHSLLALHPVRGQISWARHAPEFGEPQFPVNGSGHFIPVVPYAGGLAWFTGATYGRGDTDTTIRDADQRANQERLRSLLPAVASQLEAAFDNGHVQAWSGVRCTSTDRRPLVGEVEPGLWVSTAMGSRGLTFCALAAELIAARLHDEPLPIDQKLARSLDVSRAIIQRSAEMRDLSDDLSGHLAGPR